VSVPIETKIVTSRAELESTLDAIEDKLNVPKQASRLKAWAQKSYDANPLPWKAGATAAVVLVAGLVAWALLTDD
jgi:hypothetical protein